MEENQFKKVKGMMCEKMMLVACDPSKEQKLLTYASEERLAYIILQLHVTKNVPARR